MTPGPNLAAVVWKASVQSDLLYFLRWKNIKNILFYEIIWEFQYPKNTVAFEHSCNLSLGRLLLLFCNGRVSGLWESMMASWVRILIVDLGLSKKGLPTPASPLLWTRTVIPCLIWILRSKIYPIISFCVIEVWLWPHLPLHKTSENVKQENVNFNIQRPLYEQSFHAWEKKKQASAFSLSLSPFSPELLY